MADLPVLNAVQQRILGSLMEKQVTVPASYPLSLNALRTACNQTSSREPVMDLDEQTLQHESRELRDAELVRIVWADSGRRTRKYHQTLTGRLDLTDAETALITVLLLRGPQAPGELKTRTERLHGFADRADVEGHLAAMAQRVPALVRELPRQHGQKDSRWVHLLGPVDVDDSGPVAAPLAPAIDVLAAGPEARDAKVRDTYGTVAATYAVQIGAELDALPFERWLLDRVVVEADGDPILDAGSGPGHVAAYLTGQGATARGIDLTPEMVEQAQRDHPGIEFTVGDLRRAMRPVDAAGWGAVLAWYSLIHLAPSELPDAVAGLARILRPGGILVLALHVGGEVRHLDRWWEHGGLDLDVVLHDAGAVLAAVEAAGLTGLEWYLRGPYDARGETTQRLYVLAVAPSS